MSIEKQMISVNGNQYACLIAGNPNHPAMVMIHGWAHHPDIWRSTIQHYQSSYFCVAVGLLGLGDSDKPADGDYRIEAHARDTLAIVDQLNIDRFILMGQSRGGQIALSLAAQIAPQRVIRLVDVSGVTTGNLTPYMHNVMRPIMWLNWKLSLWNSLGRWVFKHRLPINILYSPYFANIRRIDNEILLRDFAQALRPDARLTHYRCMQTMMGTNLAPSLQRISVPTLILFGAQDGCVPPSEGQIASEHIPNNRFVLLQNCGHYPMVETPEAYFEALDLFLSTEA